MNQSIAFIGNGKEVHGDDEYSPFGKSVYYIGDKRHEKCHLEEAIQNLPDDQISMYRQMCIATDALPKYENISESIINQARCHRYLMSCVKKYWQGVEERIEGDKRLDGDC